MSKKNKYNGIVKNIIAAIFVVGIALIWVMRYVIIIGALCAFIIFIIFKSIEEDNNESKDIKKENLENIIETPFNDVILKMDGNNLQKQLKSKKEKLGLFNKDIYNSMFPYNMRIRGESYSVNRIENERKYKNKYSCVALGTKRYIVKISFKNDKILDASCTCPYYTEENKYCKHIYALLYKVKCGENNKKIIDEMKKQITAIKKMIDNIKEYLEKNKDMFDKDLLKAFNKKLKRSDVEFNDVSKFITIPRLEDELLMKLDTLLTISYNLKNDIIELLDSENDKVVDNKVEKKKEESSITLTDLAIAGAILNHLDKDDDNEDDEMESYGLEDHQKELVQKGNYDLWNFDEEDLEDDDYYYEDDD